MCVARCHGDELAALLLRDRLGALLPLQNHETGFLLLHKLRRHFEIRLFGDHAICDETLS